MDEEYFDNDVSESLVIGRYDSGQPFGSVLELIRCGECDGLYKQDHHRFIMGMYIAPTGQDAIKRRKQADEHNRKLDEIFIESKLCYCHGRNRLFTWRQEE